MSAKAFHVAAYSGCVFRIPASSHVAFASRALERQRAKVNKILVNESTGSPSRCRIVAVSTLNPKGTRGNWTASWNNGSFHVTIRVQMSSIGYGVHPVQIEFTVPVMSLHVLSVNILVPSKNMSLPGGHVALRYVYSLNRVSKSKPFNADGLLIVASVQFMFKTM